MKALISLLALSLSTVALADGFKCEQREHAVNIQVFNKTQASEGTRNVAVMILSDATCLLYTSPSPRDGLLSRMPSSA